MTGRTENRGRQGGNGLERNSRNVTGREQEAENERGRDGAQRNKADEKKKGRDESAGDEKYTHKANGNGADRQAAESGIAVRVLEACRNQLFFRQRFLEQALFRLKWVETEDIFLGSDGEHLYYDKKYILKRYTESPEQMSADYLHTVMHCLYQHPFFCPRNCTDEQEMCWDLAADMAVECVLEEMRESEAPDTISEQRSEMLRKLKQEIGFLSVQKLFSYLQKNAMQGQTECICGVNLQRLCELFQRDEHRLWYTGKREEESNAGESNAEESNAGESNAEESNAEESNAGESSAEESNEEESNAGESSAEESNAGESSAEESNEGESNAGEEGNGQRPDREEGTALSGAENREENSPQQIWKNVADRILVEAQAFAHAGRGEIAGSMLQHLKKLTRETYDYTRFLMKFAAHWEERMQIDEDEFDYAFYTYGLKLFGKVPLIEPLEYKEKNLIREFLIAIDTSGSCQGEVVERFLTKTYNILRQTQAFASRVNIHIVQCDARIQEDVRIGSQEELEAYIARLTLKGFGGTDFTPVFEYADRLMETGEIRRLDGLLYFTDGYGTFPAKPPKYRTAFVFLDKEEEVTVPPWAMKVYLDTTL